MPEGDTLHRSANRLRPALEGARLARFEAFREPPVGATHPLDHLGPDLCEPDVDLDAAVERFGLVAAPDEEVKVALLDQRIACGVGNVYASEVLHACRVDPFTPVSALGVPCRRRLLAAASSMLLANLGGGPRATVPGGGLAVYGRRGRPCRRCGTPVRMRLQGEQARSTYWCPSCRPGRQ